MKMELGKVYYDTMTRLLQRRNEQYHVEQMRRTPDGVSVWTPTAQSVNVLSEWIESGRMVQLPAADKYVILFPPDWSDAWQDVRAKLDLFGIEYEDAADLWIEPPGGGDRFIAESGHTLVIEFDGERATSVHLTKRVARASKPDPRKDAYYRNPESIILARQFDGDAAVLDAWCRANDVRAGVSHKSPYENDHGRYVLFVTNGITTIKPGEWLVSEEGGRTAVWTDKEFRERTRPQDAEAYVIKKDAAAKYAGAKIDPALYGTVKVVGAEPDQPDPVSCVLRDIQAVRRYHVDEKHCDAKNDDRYVKRELARCAVYMASYYADPVSDVRLMNYADPASERPWYLREAAHHALKFKNDPRQLLVHAAALLVAEVERIDRAKAALPVEE